jgi:hypothetical protein
VPAPVSAGDECGRPSRNTINLNELTGAARVPGNGAPGLRESEGTVSNMNFQRSGAGAATSRGGVAFAVGARDIAGPCCLRTLALKTTSG